MKFQLTKSAKQELKRLHARFSHTEDMPYHTLKARERLLCDAQMYVDDAYVSNSFKRLDSWCKRTGEGEFQKKYRMSAKKNIGKMLIEDIITIVE
jgi:hypothetical protein